MALKTSGLGLVLAGLGLDTVGLVNITGVQFGNTYFNSVWCPLVLYAEA